VPGKPALFGTTKAFLDYFDLNSLDELPTLAEIKDMDNLEPELDLEPRVDPDPDPDPVPEPADSSGDARPQTGPPAAEEPVDATAHDAENQ
jgi:segregation and condensation protein B